MTTDSTGTPGGSPQDGLGSREAAAITLFVADPRRSRKFYEQIFGLEPIHVDEDSVAFKLPNLIVNLLVESAAEELVAPGKPGFGGNGPRFELTLGVDDVEAEVRRLRELHLKILNGPIDRPWGVRTASFADPDGYVWELAQQL